MSAFANALKGFFGWLAGLFKGPTSTLQPASPPDRAASAPTPPTASPATASTTVPPQAPASAASLPLGALPGATSSPVAAPPANGQATGTSQQNTLNANLGLTQLNGQTAVAGNVAATFGDARAMGSLAMSRDATDARLLYQNPTTALEGHYTRQGDLHAVGGNVAKRFEHSSLGVGGDYNWSPRGNGGQVYGRWETDSVGETVGGFQVKGSVEAGAMKRPGERQWNSYAAGRVTAERRSTSIYVEGRHQGGPSFGAPQTQVSMGVQVKF